MPIAYPLGIPTDLGSSSDLLGMSNSIKTPPTQYHRSSITALLWQMITYAPRLYLVDTLLWLLIKGLPALPGLLIREFFNTLMGISQFTLWPWTWIALLLATGLARVIVIFTGRVTKTQHRFTMSALIQRNLLAKLMDRPGASPLSSTEGQRVSHGAVLSFFREDTQQLEDSAVSTNELLGEGIFAVGSLVLLVSINAQMTLLVFLPLMLIAALIQQMTHRIKRYRRENRQATQQVTGWVGEMFTTVQAIQVAGAESKVLNHFSQLCEQRQQAAVRDRMLTQLLDSSFSNLVSLGTGGILLVSAQLIQANTFTVGDFALFVYYLAYVTYFLGFFGEFLTLSKQSEVSFERMAGLLNCSTQELVVHRPLYLPTVAGHRPSLPSLQREECSERLRVLTAQSLTYHYPGTHCGITDISLRIPRGSITVITGPVGSGKTTLLRALLGLLPLQLGTLWWNGKIIEQPARFLVPPQVAYTPQVPHLLSSTLRDNIMLGANRSETDVMDAISFAALDRDLTTFPDGLETNIGANGMRLSGGQMQRAAAARMFVRQPELLVFDDLSSALDVETEQQLWSRLFTSRREHSDTNWTPTFLVVSHRPWVLRQADLIIVLNKGRIQTQGKLDELGEFIPRN